MLHATLKLFLPAAYVGCNAATATSATSRAAVLRIFFRLMIRLRDMRIRSLHSLRAVIEAAGAHRRPGQARESPHHLPGFCPAVYPPSLRWTVGLPLSDQHFASAKPEP